MKKIITVHIAEKVFQIEDDAYAYLNRVLSMQLKKQELEVEIAEKLGQKLEGSKTVVTYPDVVDVLYQLGFSASDAYETAQGTKKLYRQPEHKVLAGVCTGLGEYFDIDPVIIRVLFVIAFFFGSLGFWLYLVLWIVIPRANKKIKS